MSLIRANGGGLGGAGAPGGALGNFYSHLLDQSLRFNDNDSAYLSRTPASAGSLTTWTWSGWVKRGNLAAGMPARGTIFGRSLTLLGFFNPTSGVAADNFGVYLTDGEDDRFMTNRVFRDTSAWYHFVVVLDTTNSTADDRFRLYVNGVRETSFSRADAITQNRTAGVNAAAEHGIGRQSPAASQYFDGYLSDINFIDGQALDGSSFGETKDGVWIPKAYSGSYGTNGFYLPFDDSSAIGDDESGNTNDWTVNNLVATDVVPDSPTNNFAVINQLDSNVTISEGNLKALGISGTYFNAKGSFNFDVGLSDGWYFEFISISGSVNEGSVGIALSSYLFSNAGSPALVNDTKTYNPDGSINFSTTFAGDTWGNNDIIGVAVKNGKVYYSKNGVFQASADPVNETNPAHTGLTGFYAAFMYSATSSVGGVFNFGQDSSFAGLKTSGSAGASDANGIGDFYYAPPSGYLALCSSNLPEPDIIDGTDNFNTVLYTGNGSSRSITGVGFSPDWIWFKARSAAIAHLFFDSVRGATKYLQSNSTSAEGTEANSQTSFDSDGFSLGTDSTTGVNQNSTTYVAWNWKAGGTASSIAVDAYSSGVPSIASSVSANTDAGFSIVSWTGNGNNSLIGHGLSEAPKLIIVKNRDDTSNWPVYSEFIGAANRLYLDLTSGSSGASTLWNSTAATNQVFSVGTSNLSNGSTDEMIAYCFHSVEGFSKAGSYTGNGSSDGTFVHTGFRPAFVMFKNSSTTSGWTIIDGTRNPYNEAENYLYPNASDAEYGGGGSDGYDFVSNGFKVSNTYTSGNGSGNTIIYLAFAESPFKFANAR